MRTDLASPQTRRYKQQVETVAPTGWDLPPGCELLALGGIMLRPRRSPHSTRRLTIPRGATATPPSYSQE